VVTVEVGAVAHGGHCVARSGGRVIFVRHALPGERLDVRITSAGRKGRFLRGDAVVVHRPAEGRREAPCAVAARCGGCDWQHATPATSRALKAAVVREALQRFAGVALPDAFTVDEVAVPGPAGGGADRRALGLGWRTRGTLAVDADGHAGFLGPRSHDVVVVDECPQLDPRLAGLDLFGRAWPAGGRVRFVAPGEGAPAAFPVGEAPAEPVMERAAGRAWAVAADGFWQVHPGAADALVAHVLRMLAPQPGERLVDLYAGVGLYGLSLQAAVDGALELTLVEGDAGACALAQRNAGDLNARVVRASVDRWISRAGALAEPDLVVLDPPRVGAGRAVVEAVAAAGPRGVAYVACDPVALARDLATFAAHGYRLIDLAALDLFPTTHHVECVAHLAPA
jgi:tRNA/tmRNA/rRNA uracil-C5-methylase (TrmA/RlmC/RlmD family)